MKESNFFSEQKMIIFLLLLTLIGGGLYIFITPPWQAPDENVHYEYIHILSRAKLFNIKQKPDYGLQKKIIQSMDQFYAWKYVHRKAPSPLPEKFRQCPVYGESLSKVNRPPIYYFLGSFVLKIFRNNNLLVNHYLIRLFSLFISLITIYFTYRSAKLVFENDSYSILASTFFVAFLPQFISQSCSINSDILANLIGAIAIFFFLFSIKKYQNHYILLLFPIIIVFGLLTKRTTFFIIPAFIIYMIIFLYKNIKSNKQKSLISSIVYILVMVSAFLLFINIFPSLFERVDKYLFHWGGGLSELNKLLGLSFYSNFNLNFIETLFKSFWFCPGWMAFPLPNSIYQILKLISFMGIIGLIMFFGRKISNIQKNFPIKFEYLILLISICLISLMSIFIRFDFTDLPMARSIFPALTAFSILFVMGIREFIPERVKKTGLIIFIFLLIALNIYGIFDHLVNSFYFSYF